LYIEVVRQSLARLLFRTQADPQFYWGVRNILQKQPTSKHCLWKFILNFTQYAAPLPICSGKQSW
jgi:hypothetical protein